MNGGLSEFDCKNVGHSNISLSGKRGKIAIDLQRSYLPQLTFVYSLLLSFEDQRATSHFVSFLLPQLEMRRVTDKPSYDHHVNSQKQVVREVNYSLTTQSSSALSATWCCYLAAFVFCLQGPEF